MISSLPGKALRTLVDIARLAVDIRRYTPLFITLRIPNFSCVLLCYRFSSNCLLIKKLNDVLQQLIVYSFFSRIYMNDSIKKLDAITYMQVATKMLFVELMLYIPVNNISIILDCSSGLNLSTSQTKKNCCVQGIHTLPKFTVFFFSFSGKNII